MQEESDDEAHGKVSKGLKKRHQGTQDKRHTGKDLQIHEGRVTRQLHPHKGEEHGSSDCQQCENVWRAPAVVTRLADGEQQGDDEGGHGHQAPEVKRAALS